MGYNTHTVSRDVGIRFSHKLVHWGYLNRWSRIRSEISKIQNGFWLYLGKLISVSDYERKKNQNGGCYDCSKSINTVTRKFLRYYGYESNARSSKFKMETMMKIQFWNWKYTPGPNYRKKNRPVLVETVAWEFFGNLIQFKCWSWQIFKCKNLVKKFNYPRFLRDSKENLRIQSYLRGLTQCDSSCHRRGQGRQIFEFVE